VKIIKLEKINKYFQEIKLNYLRNQRNIKIYIIYKMNSLNNTNKNKLVLVKILFIQKMNIFII